VKLRRLLFAALLAVCFDVAVPLEPSLHGGLVWEDDEEEGVRVDRRRSSSAASEPAPAPVRHASAARAGLTAQRRSPRPARRVRVVYVAASPPRSTAPEDH
jgi:hypothetical protein